MRQASIWHACDFARSSTWKLWRGLKSHCMTCLFIYHYQVFDIALINLLPSEHWRWVSRPKCNTKSLEGPKFHVNQWHPWNLRELCGGVGQGPCCRGCKLSKELQEVLDRSYCQGFYPKHEHSFSVCQRLTCKNTITIIITHTSTHNVIYGFIFFKSLSLTGDDKNITPLNN